jgi:hypothetical protein
MDGVEKSMCKDVANGLVGCDVLNRRCPGTSVSLGRALPSREVGNGGTLGK